MIVEKVKLHNFRNHVQSEYYFKNGINLVLGKNGSGKSTILDAIGYALFNTLDRTNRNSDAIREGEKNAKVEVQFRADDGLSYTVERTLPSGNSIFYQNDNPALKIKLQKDVQIKLRELLGVRIESDTIFSSIILGSQNKITDIFTGTPKEKLERFDNLFNTQIYRQISSGLLKTAEDRYRKDISNRDYLLIELSGLISDPVELDQHLNSLQTQKILLEKKLFQANEDLEKHRKYLDELNITKHNIEKIKVSLAHYQIRLDDSNEQLLKLKSELSEAYGSQKITNDNKASYDKYNNSSAEIEIVTEKITSLEKLQKNYNLNKNKLYSFENDYQKYHTELIEKKSRISELNSEIISIQLKANKLKIELNDKKSELVSLKTTENDLGKISVDLSTETTILDKFKRIREDKELEINSISTNLIDVERTNFTLNNLENLAIIINDKILTRNSLQKELESIYQRINDNNSARLALDKGICPILTENCINVMQGTSIEKYFRSKSDELDIIANDIRFRLTEFDDIDTSKSKNENEIIVLRESLRQNSVNQSKIEAMNIEISKILLEMENSGLKMQLLFSNNFEFLQRFSIFTMNEFVDKLKISIEDIKVQIRDYESIIRQLEKEIITHESEYEVKTKLSFEIDSRISTLVINLENLKQNMSDLQHTIESNELELKPLDSLRESRESISNEMSLLELSYQLYIRNVDLQAKIPKLENEIISKMEQIDNLESTLQIEKIELGDIERNFSEEKYLNAKTQLDNFDSLVKTITGEYQKLDVEIKLHSDKIVQNNTYLVRKNLAENEISIINKKINLTTLLRNNLKTMGQMIANKLLEKIQYLATENLRLISNKQDSIIWKTTMESNEMYQVYLKNQNSLRAFELLSGGEQMMVAISIRAAMNSLLTNSKFVIFDEPTVNLDVEKRAALSESFTHILKSLDQAIIVTHDDSFTEMAQHIIEL